MDMKFIIDGIISGIGSGIVISFAVIIYEWWKDRKEKRRRLVINIIDWLIAPKGGDEWHKLRYRICFYRHSASKEIKELIDAFSKCYEHSGFSGCKKEIEELEKAIQLEVHNT